jgi:hypothetical protein
MHKGVLAGEARARGGAATQRAPCAPSTAKRENGVLPRAAPRRAAPRRTCDSQDDR